MVDVEESCSEAESGSCRKSLSSEKARGAVRRTTKEEVHAQVVEEERSCSEAACNCCRRSLSSEKAPGAVRSTTQEEVHVHVVEEKICPGSHQALQNRLMSSQRDARRKGLLSY